MSFVSSHGLIRFAAGALLLGFGAYYLAPRAVTTVTTKALVNARLVAVQSPIEGTVAAAPLRDGAPVRRGDVIAAVSNTTVDRSNLGLMQREVSGLSARATALENAEHTYEAMERDLTQQAAQYREARVRQQEQRLRAAQATVQSADAANVQAVRDRARKLSLRSSNAIAENDQEIAEARVAQTRAELDLARIALQRLQQELDAMRQGVFVSEERNDVPYSLQRLDEVRLRHAEALVQIAEAKGRLQHVLEQVEQESDRQKRLSSVAVESPVNGVVSRSVVILGSSVRQGGELARVIDCQQILVAAALPLEMFDKLTHDRRVWARLIGNDHWHRVETVERIGSRRGESAAQFAAENPSPDSAEFIAIFRLADLDDGSAENYCQVGRRAEVRVDGGGIVGFFARVLGLSGEASAAGLPAAKR